MSTLYWLLVLNAVVNAGWIGVKYGEYRLKKKLVGDIRDDDDLPVMYVEYEEEEEEDYNADILSEDEFDEFAYLFDMGGKKSEGSEEPN